MWVGGRGYLKISPRNLQKVIMNKRIRLLFISKYTGNLSSDRAGAASLDSTAVDENQSPVFEFVPSTLLLPPEFITILFFFGSGLRFIYLILQ